MGINTMLSLPLSLTFSFSLYISILSLPSASPSPLSDSYWLNRDLPGRLPRHSVVPDFVDVPRRHNLTASSFLSEFADSGRPLVVTGSIDQWDWGEIGTWTSEGLRGKFPGHVHARYPVPGEEKYAPGGKLIGFYSSSEVEEMRPNLEAETERAFREGGHISWLNRDPEVSAYLQSSYDLPHFLKGLGEAEGEYDPYFSLGQRSGQGRDVHMDHTCNNTFSAQLIGRTIWRLYSPSHPKSNIHRELNSNNVGAGTANDQNVNKYKSIKDAKKGKRGTESFRPTAYEFILYPGEVLVWYPGWSHETFSIDDVNTALSIDFRLPVPKKYLDYYNDVFQAHSEKFDSFNDVGNANAATCFDHWTRRANVLEVMKERNYDHQLLCENTYDGDCLKRHFGLTGEVIQEPIGDGDAKDDKGGMNFIFILFVGKFMYKIYNTLKRGNLIPDLGGDDDREREAGGGGGGGTRVRREQRSKKHD